jgi:two-component system, OmpR family, sensor kinase
MKLAARLWLLGALLPFAGTVAAVFAGGQLFRADLEHAVDEALLGQAAVEAVSLFDGPAGRPHLHLATSPLRETVRRIAPAAALYDGTGRRILRHPMEAAALLTDETLSPDDVGTDPVLLTRDGRDGARHRVLSVEVKSPAGEPHALQLAASLAEVDTTVAAFYRNGVGMALALGAALFLLQSWQARRLSRRVHAVTGHLAALREGKLDAVPPPAEGADEIAELARVVAEATEKLRLARSAQDRLVADAAHELRTPLTLMRTSIDLALRRRRDVPELVAALEETRREVDRLARLATRLLDLATAGRGAWDRAPGDLVPVVAGAAEAIRAEAEVKGVLVQVEAPGPVGAVFDANGIRQAVDNLLANAVRFSPPGRGVLVTVAREDGVVRIAVQDEGPGIPAAERERVFEPFERGARSTGGAGLGLAIVRENARGHGGRAYVADSTRGARVVLELPAAAAS